MGSDCTNVPEKKKKHPQHRVALKHNRKAPKGRLRLAEATMVPNVSEAKARDELAEPFIQHGPLLCRQPTQTHVNCSEEPRLKSNLNAKGIKVACCTCFFFGGVGMPCFSRVF